jgi:hypothetical protein
MEYAIMTPRATPPIQSSMQEHVYWDGSDADGEKGIKAIDILFQCAADYTVNQIGLTETAFNFV